MNSPCLDCKDRSQYCHSDCERYAEYRVICDKIKAARREGVDSREPFLTRGDKIRRDVHRRGFCKF